ncbi:60S ribosomal protein L11 [Galemys pyrenaicus]|uniref:60S ribosomal protein L11 n=1 Tax=Galemys pyrenaicus TaxID=202257 RepID=A0A8J5ZQS0_GALPY|nr:60S ribosomal protein L11 [Galemys pyrenaicus]
MRKWAHLNWDRGINGRRHEDARTARTNRQDQPRGCGPHSSPTTKVMQIDNRTVPKRFARKQGKKAVNKDLRQSNAALVMHGIRVKRQPHVRTLHLQGLSLNLCEEEGRQSMLGSPGAGQTPVLSRARYSVRSFGIRRNAVCEAKSEEILEKNLEVEENE